MYPKIGITCDVVVFHIPVKDLFRHYQIYDKLYVPEFLTITRKNEPYKGMNCLPGGFLDEKEELRDCAARELEEETSLKIFPKDLIYVGVKDCVNRDERQRVITHAYTTFVTVKPYVTGLDDAESAQWTNSLDLGFDHREIVRKSWDTLIDYLRNIK